MPIQNLQCFLNENEFTSARNMLIIMNDISITNNNNFHLVFDVWKLSFPQTHIKGVSDGSIEITDSVPRFKVDSLMMNEKKVTKGMYKKSYDQEMKNIENLFENMLRSFSEEHNIDLILQEIRVENNVLNLLCTVSEKNK